MGSSWAATTGRCQLKFQSFSSLSFLIPAKMRHGLSPIIYAIISLPSCILPMVLAILAFPGPFDKARKDNVSLYSLVILLFMSIVLRAIQISSLVVASYYFKSTFFRMRAAFSILALSNTVLWFVFGKDINEMMPLAICVLYTDVLCIAELVFGERFRQFLNNMVLDCAEFRVACDSLARSEEDFNVLNHRNLTFKKVWMRIADMFKIRRTGPVALPYDEEALVLTDSISLLPDSAIVPPELAKIVEHWAQLSTKEHRALWISRDTISYDSISDKTSYDPISDEITAILASPELGEACSVAVKVDMREARAIFWPLLYGLVRASPDYMDELGLDPPWLILNQISATSVCLDLDSYNSYRAPWPDAENTSDLLDELICQPLLQRYKRLQRPLARATLIVQGMTCSEQVAELYHTIETLHDRLEEISPWLNIVVLGTPPFFKLITDEEGKMMDHVCALYISDGGPVVYSETVPTSPRLAQNIFLLLINAIQGTGGLAAERMWNTARDVARWASQETVFTDPQIRP
ncbi:hypothetical protein K438DRAFT_587536 [Mycena galopus ATCC 62051]|nr:hypothetical protein K438DRAFT_587536 [Mycena galopus ATCC 62051]